jgi:hypothetical protein
MRTISVQQDIRDGEVKLAMLDIKAPNHGVQINVSHDGDTIWVNVDGICMLRICQIQELEIHDDRKEIEK